MRIEDKLLIGFMVCLLFGFCLSFVGNGYLLYHNYILNDQLIEYNMMETDSNDFVETNGFYSSDGFYCVRTEGRTLEEIDRTDCHEVFHAYLNGDLGTCLSNVGANEITCRQHFCDNI